MEDLKQKLNTLTEEKDTIDKELEESRLEAIGLIKEALKEGKSREELVGMGFSKEYIDEAEKVEGPEKGKDSESKKNEESPSDSFQTEEKSWEQFQEEVINDKNLNYEKSIKKLHDEYDRRNKSEQEGIKSPEEIMVDKTRQEYVKEYLKCKKEVRKQVRMDRIKSSLNIFRKKENKITVNEEDYFTKEYKEKKDAYDKARVDMGNTMFNKRKAELEAEGLSGEELKSALENYKSTEILTKTILDERQKLIDAKAQGSPVNPSAWKELWNKYQKLPRYKKVLISTAIFATAASVGAGAVTGSIAGAAGWRFLKGMMSGTVVAHSVKGIDVINKKSNEKFKADQNQKLSELRERFGKGEIDQREFEKRATELMDQEKKRNRNQTLAKMGVGIILGAGVGALAAHEFGGVGGSHHHDSTGGTNHPDNSTVKTNPLDNSNQSTSTSQPAIEHKIIDAEVGKGHGAIKTIHELQEKLKAEYGNDLSKAPASVQHILDTKADKLAMEYGMFKPGEDAESAMFKVGGKFEVDQSGNVSYQEAPGLKAELLEKGDELKASGTYEGKMFDSDQSGKVNVENNIRTSTLSNPEELPQTAPEIIDQNAFVPAESLPVVDESQLENGQIEPEIKDLSENKIEDNLNNAPKIEAENAKEIINPSNPKWTPRFENETGGVKPISPTGSNYNIQTNPENIPGNGFTREVPMTNQEAGEFYGSKASVNEAITVRDNTIMSDPRHLETARDVRETFGGRNVLIDRPDESTVNGMGTEEWNKSTDDMFRQKDVKFDSYADYEKERQLQEFFGKGTKGVEYDPSLDKMVEGVHMYYFRETPEWETIKTLPAKDFFDFNKSEIIDGKGDNVEKLNSLVKGGVVEDRVSRGGAHNYSFTHEDELKRLAKTYAEIDPLNATPIGDESMERYIARITRDLHKTEDGTLFMFRDSGLEKSVDDGSFMDRKIERYANMRSRVPAMGNNSYTNGGYYYDPRTTGLANRANDIIGSFFGYNKWTH